MNRYRRGGGADTYHIQGDTHLMRTTTNALRSYSQILHTHSHVRAHKYFSQTSKSFSPALQVLLFDVGPSEDNGPAEQFLFFTSSRSMCPIQYMIQYTDLTISLRLHVQLTHVHRLTSTDMQLTTSKRLPVASYLRAHPKLMTHNRSPAVSEVNLSHLTRIVAMLVFYFSFIKTFNDFQLFL